VLVDKHLLRELPVKAIGQHPDRQRFLQIHQVHKQSLLLVVVLVELEGQVVVIIVKQHYREDLVEEVAQAPDHHLVDQEPNHLKTPEYQT
tara:strand:- start:156 stop:425 length:270 start_codon:yes stop_codon:yes gene_type:complete